MRVLLSTDTMGGVWRYTVDLARALAPDAEIVIATLGEPPDAGQRAELDGLPVIALDQPLDWLAEDPGALAQAGRVLADVASAERCDVRLVHAPALVQPGVPAVSVLHSDVATWHEAVRGGELPPDLAWRAAATWAGCLASECVVAVSAPYARAVRRHCAVPLRVVPNGVPARSVRTSGRVRGVMTAGRLWDPAKGAGTLDLAAAALSYPMTMFGVADAGPDRSFAVRHAEYGGVLPQSALLAVMDETEIYASAALYEPFGLGVLEAARSGMALVLSDIPTHRALWEDAAVFVDPRDVALWAATLNGLLKDPERIVQLGAAAAAAATNYTIARTGAATLRLLRMACRAYA